MYTPVQKIRMLKTYETRGLLDRAALETLLYAAMDSDAATDSDKTPSETRLFQDLLNAKAAHDAALDSLIQHLASR